MTVAALLRQLERKSRFTYKPRKEKIMKKVVSIFSILFFTLELTACNTMKGFGQDVERGGEKVQGAADKQQQK